MITKYRATTINNTIKQVFPEIEHKKSVVIGGVRRNKLDPETSYFDTWDEAYLFLINAGTKEIDTHARLLQQAQDRFVKLRLMQPPVATFAHVEGQTIVLKSLDPVTLMNESVNIAQCPKCRGPADNGHDRHYPPSPYQCTKCES